MAYKDCPIIDTASRNSNLSETFLESRLSQRAGFICRKDVPDKGCDYYIELIENGNYASGWRFALQLKSVENLTLIANGEFISYSFETSRLGYLMRHVPALGVIAIYSVKDNKVFYELVDKVYERLMEERDNDEWKQNDKVNIHIPTINVLDENNVSVLHQVFMTRFEQAVIMQNSHGDKYGLPSINVLKTDCHDLNSVSGICAFLKEFGSTLIRSSDVTTYFVLVSQLPHTEICKDFDLLKIAAVAYCEAGHHSESNLYCKRFLKRETISLQDSQMIMFSQLKNDLALGEINSKEFVDRCKELKNKETSDYNALLLEINIAYYEFLQIKPLYPVPESLIASIESAFKRIEKCDTEQENRNLLLIGNTENYGLIVSKSRSKCFYDIRLSQSLVGEVPENEWIKLKADHMNLEVRYMDKINELARIATVNNDKLLQSHITSSLTRYWISKEVDYISYEFANSNEIHEKLLSSIIIRTEIAFNLYLELSLYKDAYQILCYAHELIEVSRFFYKYSDAYELGTVSELMAKLELMLDFAPYSPILKNLVQSKQSERVSDNNMMFLKDFDDEQIDILSKQILEKFELHSNCLNNIKNELLAYRLFNQRCTNPDIQVLQPASQVRGKEYIYCTPIKFALLNKKSGLQTTLSSDMNYLLTAIGN